MILLARKGTPSPLGEPSYWPAVPESSVPTYLYNDPTLFQLRGLMSGPGQKLFCIFISTSSCSKFSALLESKTRSLGASFQSRAPHFLGLHDAIDSQQIQGRGGMKNLQWKQKPKANTQIYINNSINNVENLIDSKSSEMKGTVRSIPSSVSQDKFREGSAGQASSANVSADVSVVGKVQPVWRVIPVESSNSSVNSLDSKAANLGKIGVRPSGGTVDGGRAGTSGSLNSNEISGSDFGNLASRKSVSGQKSLWVAKGHATQSGINNLEQVESPVAASGESPSVAGPSSSTLKAQDLATVSKSNHTIEEEQPVKGLIGGDFVVDNCAFARSQIQATFYPKFENEKSDQEIRMKMIEKVSQGNGTLEVSLKHSGSLFMYAGHEGGAYAKNSYGNIYTAVGIFVLGRMFQESWGAQAATKQKEFNDFLQKNHMCISMELVTAVLGDHGQRPLQDYVVVTAVTELGAGKPRFYSTPDIISFCRKWRLPTNSIWLFSTKKSVASFFAAYDALCEEGTATSVCKALDEIADISVPATKDHVKVQGEILEGLVARIVSSESSEHLKKVLEEIPPSPDCEDNNNLGLGLREICAANKSSEQQQIKALLRSVGTAMCPDYTDWFGNETVDMRSKSSSHALVAKFRQSHPADYATSKLQEMIGLLCQKRFPAELKCRYNFRKFPYSSSNCVHFKMVVHIYSDSGFRRYQKEMRNHPGLWPLYRGFFVDINLFKVSEEKASQISKDKSLLLDHMQSSFGTRMFDHDDLADEAENLMIKLKFLTYKLRTFLIRNGLSILFKQGKSAYKDYYLRQMKIWGTSHAKQKEMSKMLDEWALYILKKHGGRQIPSSTYLSEAEPFLEQYARQSVQNQRLIGSAGNLIKTEDFLVGSVGGLTEEDDLVLGDEQLPMTPPAIDKISKAQGMIVFFPGIPGCGKSAVCKEIINAPGGLGDERPLRSPMGDLIKGRYWQKVAEEWKRKPYEIILADKNAPNEEVWRQIEDMSRSTKGVAVPVVTDSEGTDSNPFSLDALAVFMFRVLQRVNHPGNLDKNSQNAGYVLLMFYNLYEGKSRREFEEELCERFGLLVKMPSLKSDSDPLPDSIKLILEEGLDLYNLHTKRHGRQEPSKGSYAKDWSLWEKRCRETFFANAEYLNAIQVPFEDVVKHVLEDLRAIAKGDYVVPSTEKRKLGTIVFAAVSFVADEVKSLLDKIADSDSRAKGFLKDKDIKNTLNSAHITLAHKRSHGVTSVASYGVYRGKQVPTKFTAILFSDKLAALEAQVGCIGSEQISSKNEWPHVTIWTGAGATPKEANTLPQLVSQGHAIRVDFKEPFSLTDFVD
ncbi:hypothetical protein SUGI_0502400 [Cryptomeria japonica]|nr:hypothetical protein SUGI_0502400 [Cryptomeria japonica]